MAIKNLDICSDFINGAEEGKGSNLFIEDNTLYSYGRHFPLAKRTPQGMLFNPTRYSNSTAKHQTYFQRVATETLWEVDDCEPKNIHKDICKKLYFLFMQVTKAKSRFIEILYNITRTMQYYVDFYDRFQVKPEPNIALRCVTNPECIPGVKRIITIWANSESRDTKIKKVKNLLLNENHDFQEIEDICYDISKVLSLHQNSLVQNKRRKYKEYMKEVFHVVKSLAF